MFRSPLAADALFAPMLADFVGRLPSLVGELTDAAAAEEWADVARVAHRLRGAGGSYGFPAITAAAGAVEDAVRSAPTPARAGDLVTVLIAVLRHTDGYDPGHGVPPGEPGDPTIHGSVG